MLRLLGVGVNSLLEREGLKMAKFDKFEDLLCWQNARKLVNYEILV